MVSRLRLMPSRLQWAGRGPSLASLLVMESFMHAFSNHRLPFLVFRAGGYKWRTLPYIYHSQVVPFTGGGLRAEAGERADTAERGREVRHLVHLRVALVNKCFIRKLYLNTSIWICYNCRTCIAVVMYPPMRAAAGIAYRYPYSGGSVGLWANMLTWIYKPTLIEITTDKSLFYVPLEHVQHALSDHEATEYVDERNQGCCAR